jgi:hypothetical protein
MKLEEILTRLDQAFDALYPIRGHLESDTSEESALALGEVLGNVAKARASIRRDIQFQSPSASNAKPSTTQKRTES